MFKIKYFGNTDFKANASIQIQVEYRLVDYGCLWVRSYILLNFLAWTSKKWSEHTMGFQ